MEPERGGGRGREGRVRMGGKGGRSEGGGVGTGRWGKREERGRKTSIAVAAQQYQLLLDGDKADVSSNFLKQ